MKVREERIHTDRKLPKAGAPGRRAVDRLLETVEAGPYDFGDKGIDWGRVLHGDRFSALLKSPSLKFGADYAFAVPCLNDACRAGIEWEVDLGALRCCKLSEGSRAAFGDGNRFETVLPNAGKRVWFRLLTGADERKLPQLRREAGDRHLWPRSPSRSWSGGHQAARAAAVHRGPVDVRRRLHGRRVRPRGLRRGHDH